MAAHAFVIARRAAAGAVALLFALALGFSGVATAHADTDYDLWIEGTRVTSDNAADVFNDGGSVSFKLGSGGVYELTLEDAELGMADVPGSSLDAAGIYTKQNLTIILKGESFIDSRNSGGTVENRMAQGIEADKNADVTIKGDGTLVVFVRGFDSTTGVFGVWGHGFFEVAEQAVVQISVRRSDDSYVWGVTMDKGVHVGDDAQLLITASAFSNRCRGIYGADVTFDGRAKAYVITGDNSTNQIAIEATTVKVGDEAFVRCMGSGTGIEAQNISASNNSVMIANQMESDTTAFKITLSSGRFAITDHAMVMGFAGSHAFSTAPDASGHYNPSAYVGQHPGNYEFVSKNGSIDYSAPFVCIPGAPIIARIAGDYANETAAKISQSVFGTTYGSVGVVVLARDDDFADALGATGLAGALGAPILLTDRTTLSPAAAKEINRLHADAVFIIGGPGAMKDQLETDLQEQCGIDSHNIFRIYGENSYDTSLACAEAIEEETGRPADMAIVAMSTNFQDALSMSPIAYSQRCPIILQTWGATSADRGFTDEAKAYLADKDIIVAGGKGAISDASLSGLNVEARLWGETGYDTSQAIAQWAVDEEGYLSGGGLVIACGAQAPKGTDALAGSALAGMYECPILLVNGNERMESVNTVTIDKFAKSHAGEVREIYVLGGSYVMPPELFAKIQATLGNAHEIKNF